MIRCLLPAAILLLTAPVIASLYQPDEANVIPVKPDGVAEPLSFDEYQQRRVTLANVADARPIDGKPNRDRAKVLERVRAFPQKKNPTADELAIHAVDLLRLGNTDPSPGDPGLYLDKAIDLLVPHTRDRNLNYFLLMTLAQVHLARGETREAVNVFESAMLDTEMPATVKGWSDAQRNWQKKLDEDDLRHYLHLRAADRESQVTPDKEEPTPLFPLSVKGKALPPVRFVNESGVYEPGSLAKTERDKLPPDAVAITQQMLLWFPSDTRLHWLLAELYAAEGKLAEANTIFDQCAWGRQYGNRRLLMEHRLAVAAALAARMKAEEVAAEERRRAEEQAALDASPINLKVIWYYFAAVVLVAAVAFVRSRTKKGGSQPCCGG